MLKILIWFCVVVLVSCKPSPDGKTREQYNNYQYIKSLMSDGSDSEQSEASLDIATSNKKDGCDCKDQALDKGVQNTADKQAKIKRDCCCCDNCCCDWCGGCHCGDCCSHDCCHGGDCCCHDCCHDCCHGDCGHCGCDCLPHFHILPVHCCINTAADKAKSAKAAAAPADNSTGGNATDVGNATFADSAKEKTTKPNATDTAAAPSKAADKAHAIMSKEDIYKGKSKGIHAALDLMKTLSEMKFLKHKRCNCRCSVSKACADKDSEDKDTNNPEDKSHCCCGCHHHHCHGCGCHHHGCHHHCGCHHHHHHHHHHCCCCNNKNGTDNNSCCGNKAGSDSGCGCASNDENGEKEDEKKDGKE